MTTKSKYPGYLQCVQACEQEKNDERLWSGFAQYINKLGMNAKPGQELDLDARVATMEMVWLEQRGLQELDGVITKK